MNHRGFPGGPTRRTATLDRTTPWSGATGPVGTANQQFWQGMTSRPWTTPGGFQQPAPPVWNPPQKAASPGTTRIPESGGIYGRLARQLAQAPVPTPAAGPSLRDAARLARRLNPWTKPLDLIDAAKWLYDAWQDGAMQPWVYPRDWDNYKHRIPNPRHYRYLGKHLDCSPFAAGHPFMMFYGFAEGTYPDGPWGPPPANPHSCHVLASYTAWSFPSYKWQGLHVPSTYQLSTGSQVFAAWDTWKWYENTHPGTAAPAAERWVKPSGVPRDVEPQYTPVPRPGLRPHPAYRTVAPPVRVPGVRARARQNPFLSPTEQSVSRTPSTWPEPIRAPWARVVVSVPPSGPPRLRATEVRHPRPFRPVGEERKRANPLAVQVWALANVITEGKDFVDALYRALPEKCQTGGGLHARAAAVVRCFPEMDTDQALENLALNHIQDDIIGRLSPRGARDAFGGPGTNPFGLETGPAL